MILSLTAIFGAAAKTAVGAIRTENIKVSESNGEVRVSFEAHIDRKAVKRNHTLVFAPVLTNGEYSVSMHPIVLEGKGARTSEARREWASGTVARYDGAVYAENGSVVDYTAGVTAQRWMNGATLKLERVLGGCCSYDRLADETLASDLALWKVAEPKTETASVAEPAWVPETMADSLSMAFSFILPESEYDENDPFRIYDDERENSLVVYFRLAKYNIVGDYMDNEQTLRNLVTTINMILNAHDSEVKHIVVAGFSSPEGSFEQNSRLAFERAVSVKEHIMKETGVEDARVKIYNGSADWRGLRAMVSRSQLPEKQKVIEIIDNAPVVSAGGQEGRLVQLRKLDGGRTYNYLLNEYFPYLRNGAFIKVYYKNK